MKNMRIKTKLLMQSTFLMLGLTALGVISLVFMYRMNERNTAINDNWLAAFRCHGRRTGHTHLQFPNQGIWTHHRVGAGNYGVAGRTDGRSSP